MDLQDALKAREAYERKKKQTTLLEWIQEQGIRLRGKPFSFEGHAYLKAIYEDTHPYMVFEKAAQMGLSTYFMLKGLWLAHLHGRKVLHFFPTDDQADLFSNDRFTLFFLENPDLAAHLQTDNIRLRHFGRGSLVYQGLFNLKKAKMMDGDMVVLDEFDEVKPLIGKYALDRILHSDLKWVAELSQPSLPDYGVDINFQASDKRYWLIRCKCGEWVNMEKSFPDCIAPRNGRRRIVNGIDRKYARICPKCGAELDLQAGEWVAENPSVEDRRGYHISQLYSSLISADEIWKAYQDARKSYEKARFTNSIIGNPYTDRLKQPLTDEVFRACEADFGFQSSSTGAVMGIDQGDLLHIVLLQPFDGGFQLIRIEETEDWKLIDRLMKKFNVRVAVCDALPNKHTAKSYGKRYEKRWFIQYFTGEEVKFGLEDTVNTIKVNRTDSLDDLVLKFHNYEIQLPDPKRLTPKDTALYERYQNHLKNLVKDLVEKPNGLVRYEYKHRIENHFAMATNSALLAATIYREKRQRLEVQKVEIW
ncbi:MAG: hypothetical protein D6712_17785 [Chloroflexi bacterium]|nr:MAG: hypothetical protein D6712_17785 [Chloroflexota bacterium]